MSYTNNYNSNQWKPTNIFVRKSYQKSCDPKQNLKKSIVILGSVLGSTYLLINLRDNKVFKTLCIGLNESNPELREKLKCFGSFFIKAVNCVNCVNCLNLSNLNEDQLRKMAENIDNGCSSVVQIIRAKELRFGIFKISIISGYGSGFIVDSSGLILTNAHVVKCLSEVKVKLLDGREFNGKVLYREKTTDLALIKINTGEELPYIELGHTNKLRDGDGVIAIGKNSRMRHEMKGDIIFSKNSFVPPF